MKGKYMAKKTNNNNNTPAPVIEIPVVVTSTNDRLASSEWDFPVETSPLLGANGTRTGLFGVFRGGDSPLYFGQYTRGEKLITHKQIVDTVRERLSSRGLKWNEDIRTSLSGARLHAQFKISGLQYDGPGNDRHQVVLEAQNSYDNSLCRELVAFAERLACLNQAYIHEQVSGERRRHSVSVSFVDMVDRQLPALLEVGKTHAAELQLLAGQSVTLEQGAVILENLTRLRKNSLSARTAERIKSAWFLPSPDEKPLGDTLYRLLQSGTRVFRDMEASESFENARRAGPTFTNPLGLAARRPDVLKTLVTPGVQNYYFDSN